MIHAGISVLGSTVTVMGLTFKENCPDLRNSRVIDVIEELKDFGINVQVADPQADAEEARHEYGVQLTPFEQLAPADAVVVAVSHREFAELSAADWLKLCRAAPLLIDIKGTLDKDALLAAGARYWRL